MTNSDVYSINASGANIFAATLYGVFISADNGKTWTAVNNGLADTHVWAFCVNDTAMFAGTGRGVFISTDKGKNWASVNTGLTTNDIHSLAAGTDYIYAGTESSGVWKRPLPEMIGNKNNK